MILSKFFARFRTPVRPEIEQELDHLVDELQEATAELRQQAAYIRRERHGA